MNTLTPEERSWIDEQSIRNNTTIAKDLVSKFSHGEDYDTIESYRRMVARHRGKSVTPLESSEEFKKASSRVLSKSKYLFLTWEQNETPLHKQLWENILKYKEFWGAELSVILGRYKNPTSVHADATHDNWNPLTEPYWDANRHELGKHVCILSDVKVTPTAKYPLTGLSHLSGERTGVIGHPKMHMNSQAVLNGYHKKNLWTTGAVTLPNYTDSKAGKESEGKHKFGFLVVEIREDGEHHIRQVEATEEGTFIDLGWKVENGEITQAGDYLGMVCGDTHFGHHHLVVDKVNDDICHKYGVKEIVLHDVGDGESANNHILKNPIQKFKRVQEGKHLIKKELEDTMKWLTNKLRWNPVIPQANHNDRFDRILMNDWRDDIHNAMFYFEYTKLACQGKLDKGVLAYYLEKHLPTVKCLSSTDSYKIGRYEVSQHGDVGAGGSRGSVRGFHNLGIPVIIGHTHCSYRADDCFCVGTNTNYLLGYNNKGASGWRLSNILTNELGIGQAIHFLENGEYTTMRK